MAQIPSSNSIGTAFKNTVGKVKDIFNPDNDRTSTFSDTAGTSTNILDEYDVPTYHIKLFLANFIGVDLSDPTGIKPLAVLAETGVTDISIDKLSFETVYGFQSATYTSFSNVFNFELKEPLGTTFLNRVHDAAAIINAENFTKIPFFLEVSFRARDRNTGEPVVVEGATQTFPIHIIECDIKVDGGGSVYKCKAVRTNDYAHDDNIGIIPQDISLEVSNLQDVGTKLANYLNSGQYFTQNNANFTDETYPTEFYVFDFSEIPDQEFYTNSQQEKSGRNNSYDKLNFDDTTIHISSGAAINRVIDMLMTNSKWLQTEIGGQKNADKDNNEHDLDFKNVFKIETNIQFVGYHRGMGDYIRVITYVIKPFTVGTSAGSTINPQENKTPNTVNYNQVLPVQYGKNGEIVRKYNYLYTGMNTSVMNFDFNVKLAWYTAMPQQYGLYPNSYQNDAGNLVTPIVSQGSRTGSISAKIDADNANKIVFVKNDAQKPDAQTPDASILQDPPSWFFDRDNAAANDGTYPSSFRAYPYWHDNFGIIEPDRTGSRGKTSTLLRSYVQNAQQEFVTINLEIRGDPYWFTNGNKTDTIKYFLFKTGFPSEPSEQDGLMKIGKDSLVTGLFQVLKTENKFEDGIFTQKLLARRELLTKVVGDATGDGQ